MSLEQNRGKRGAVAYSSKIEAVVFSHINENEKWACVKVYRATHAVGSKKMEILKSLKDLINQFIDDKYNEICIKFYNYLELNKKEIEFLIHYSYNDLNKPLNDTLFYDFIDTYSYDIDKEINGKLIEIEKRLEIKFECGFDDDKGNQICRFFEITGTSELKGYEITAFIRLIS
jgi:hypothetical protein